MKARRDFLQFKSALSSTEIAAFALQPSGKACKTLQAAAAVTTAATAATAAAV